MLFVVTQQESLAVLAGDLHPVGLALAAHNGADAGRRHPATDAINAIAVGCGGC
jgi:hypothetical protein